MASRGPALARLDLKVIVPAGVAGGAGHVCVTKGQGKADRRSAMIDACEVCISPRVHSMALLAARREIRAHVVWYSPAKRSGALEILRMARIACCRQSLELPCRGSLMAV